MKLVVRALRGVLVVSLLAVPAVPLTAAPALAVAPAQAPTLLSPGDGETVGGDPTLSWSAVPGAAKYRVQVSRTAVFDSLVYNADTFNRHATPTTALPTGPLYWRVAATDGSNGVGPFAVGTFTRVWAFAPAVVSPADGATLTYPDDPLLFTWLPLAGAQKYTIQIDDDVNFISPLNSVTTNNTSFTLTDPQTNEQQFFWRVQGVSGSVVSPYSEPRSYRVEWPAKPVLTSPAVGATVTDVVFQWTPVAGAATYEIEVSPSEDFNSVTLREIVKGTRFSPKVTLQNASYFWRVRARDAKSTPNLGGWSSLIEAAPGSYVPAQFTRAWNDRPTLLSPAPGDFNVSRPTFRWTPVPYASHYELQVGTDSNFSPGTYKSCFTNQTSFTPYSVSSGTSAVTPGLCDVNEKLPNIGQVSYWRVRGIDAPGTVLGLFSDPASFMARHAGLPVPLAPDHGATVTAPTMRWTPIVGISRYKVTWIRADTGSTSSAETYATSYTPTGLVAGKSYNWYVQTLDDQGRLGLSPMEQNYRQFTFQPETPVETVLTLVTPAPGAASAIMPEMSWLPVVGANKYYVYMGVDGTNTFSLLGETTATSYTSPALPPTPTSYAWMVNAVNTQNEVIATSYSSTFTMASLDLVTGLLPDKCTPHVVCTSTPETPRLEWSPVPYAGGYLVYLANDASFTNVVRVYRTQYTSLTPRESLLDSVAGQAYYWFVRPCRMAETGCGRFDNEVFGSASAFRKRSLPVEALSPADGATQAEPIAFSWAEYAGTNAAATPAAAQGAKTYRIQVSTVADFATTIDTQDVDQTTYTPWDKTYPEGPLYWRVAAIDGSNNQLTYSPARMVVKATPPLEALNPAPGVTESGAPYFQWRAQPHVKQYELEVYKNGDALFSSANRVINAVTRLTAFTPTTSLPAGPYAWRVRRADADARPGPWTSGGVFTVAATPPALLTPSLDTVFTDDAMLFTWTPVTGAAKYAFEASKSTGFVALVDSAQTVMTAWAPTVRYDDGRIYWRVKVLDAENNVTAVSDPFSFVKDATAPTVTAYTPTTGLPISGGAVSVTFSEPVKGVSASTFTLKVARSGAPVAGTVTPGATTETSTATFTPSAPLVLGETYTVEVGSGVSDVHGNALKPFTVSRRTVTAMDATSPAVKQYWDRDTSTAASGGGFLASRTAGAKVRYTFTGTSASILGRKARDGGYAEVWLDGVKQATVSFYAAGTYDKRLIWSKTGLANAEHTVELRVLGTRPTGSASAWVYPDAFRYGATTLEETSPRVVQTHRNAPYSPAVGGSYAVAAHTATGDTGTQPYVTFTFKGAGVYWYGYRLPTGGIAKVYVDGVGRGTIDTYGVRYTNPDLLWSLRGLTDTTHTVKIVLAGTKRAESKGYDVTFDSFAVL